MTCARFQPPVDAPCCPDGCIPTVPDCYRCELHPNGQYFGLSDRDRVILHIHRSLGLLDGLEAYLHVPVTRAVCPPGLELSDRMRALQSVLWPHRPDLILRNGHTWTIAEVKPTASYLALGQLLFYQHHAAQHYACLENAALMVITDACPPEDRELFERYGVLVRELPRPELAPPYMTK